MRFTLFILAPLLAQAQLALFTFDGTTETPVGAAYALGAVSSNSTAPVRFHVRNSGPTPVTVTPIVNNGQPGPFSLASVGGATPCSGPNGLLCIDFTVNFLAPPQSSTNNYSASLQVSSPATSSVTVLLTASSVPGPALTGSCLQPASTAAFGPVSIGSQGVCTFSLANPNAAPITVATVTVTGDPAFQLAAIQTPLTLAPNTAAPFTVQFAPRCGTALYNGILMINSVSYSMTGSGITPALPTPALHFDASSFSSMEQHTLTLALPSPAVCGATGSVNLAFAPSVSVTGDSTIVFVSTTSRSLNFTVATGATSAVINGQPSAVFATGSTAGTISFSLSGTQPALAGGSPVASFQIAPAVVAIDSATASNQRAGELDVTVIGYDNTFSLGKMSFTFFDAGGNTIGSAIAADFTANFQSFYQGQQMGSTFLMRVSFPVTGNQAQVAKVQATLTNSAGQIQTGTLTFQ